MNEFMSAGFYWAFALSAIGSAMGIGIAAQAAIGAWKKAFLTGKGASAAMIVFIGVPLSQVFYGLITMNAARDFESGLGLTVGLAGGLAIGLAAMLQGKAAAYACDALGETGKGFGSYITAIGIIETVALFVMVFSLGAAG